MRQLVLVGSAIMALIITPISIASTADARAKDKANMGYCKSGARVGDMKDCKENGGSK
jgi:hypothetical protein